MSDPADAEKREPDYSRALLWALLIGFMVNVVRHAWLSDDAFISFRAASNWVTGHGLVSNPGERVQSFTNPLWTVLLGVESWALGSIYWSAMLASFACAAGLAVLIARRYRDRPLSGLLAFALLIGCRSFVAYSTSGLENTLAHLLFAVFVFQELDEKPRWPILPWLLAGLIATNRFDHALLVLPSLVMRARRDGVRPSLKRFAIGFSPLFAWLIFAIVYYGFPFPNTAYAKLNAAMPKREVLMQGLSYLIDTALRESLLVTVVGVASLLVIRARKRMPRALPLVVGLFLYATYVVLIGGDFMGGRFFTVSYLIATLLFVESVAEAPRAALYVFAAIALFWGRDVLEPLPVEPKTECAVPVSGIVDERACYTEHTGIAQNFRKRKYETHQYFEEGKRWRSAGERVVVSQLVGLAGYGAGPSVHIIDENGLTDPLLARIQYKPVDQEWRPGHFRRAIPAGYLETVQSGQNLLADPCLHSLYDDVRLVTRGPIFASVRWRAIWKLNFVRGGCRQPAPPDPQKLPESEI